MTLRSVRVLKYRVKKRGGSNDDLISVICEIWLWLFGRQTTPLWAVALAIRTPNHAPLGCSEAGG